MEYRSSNTTLAEFLKSKVDALDLFVLQIHKTLKVLEDCIAFVGLVGNLIIIYFFVQINRRKLKKMTPYHFLLIQLAIIDFIVCIGVVASSFYLTHNIGQTYSSVVISLLKVFLLDSNLVLIIISFLRYQRIVHPLKNTKWTKLHFVYISVAAFLISLAIFLPLFSQDHKLVHFTVFDLSTVIVAILSFTLSCLFYYRISKVLANAPHSRSKERNRKALATLKFLIRLFTLTVVFGKMLYMAFSLALDNTHFSVDAIEYKTLSMMEAFARGLIYLNSVGNVFIYLKTVPGFYRFVLSTFCCCKRKE